MPDEPEVIPALPEALGVKRQGFFTTDPTS